MDPSNELVQVYVPLLDEGTDVWRPTSAEDLGEGKYRLLATDPYDPEDETWEFLPGTVVRAEMRPLRSGAEEPIDKLTAVAAVDEADVTALSPPKRDGQVHEG